MEGNRIKIGAHQLSWGTSFSPEMALPRMQRAKELGCEAFEVFLGSNVPTKALKEAAEKTGMTLIGCAVISEGDGDPLSINAEIREKAEETIKKYIQQVSDMGSSLLVGPLANVLAKPGARPPALLESHSGLETFRNIARCAAKKNVRVAIEPLQWSEMPWPNTVDQTLGFITGVEVRRPGPPEGFLGVLFDGYHANRMEENWLKALKAVLATGRLFHVHVAGPNRTPPRIGQHISWTKLVSALRNDGWEGTITIESFGDECDLPYEVVGPGGRLPAEKVITTGVATLKKAGLREGY